MKRLCYAVAMASLVTPALAQEQSARTMGSKQKTWQPANFRAGLSACSVAPSPDGVALSGEGLVAFDDSDGEGLDLAVAGADGGAPGVTAHAINTKGTGASNGRAMEQSCALVVSSGDHGSRRPVAAIAASCSVSGDPDAPSLRFTVPLSAFGAGAAAKNYVGHVTLMKRGEGVAAQTRFVSKKGYDHYQAQSDTGSAGGATVDMEMTVVAACDTSGLSQKAGKPAAAGYDLAVGKKA